MRWSYATHKTTTFKPGDTVWYFTAFKTPERKRTFWTDSAGKRHTRYVTVPSKGGYWEPGAVVLSPEEDGHYLLRVTEWCGQTCKWLAKELRVATAHIRQS